MPQSNTLPTPSKVPKLEILELQPLQDAGALRAFFSVRIAGKITVHKMRLVQQDGQAAWISGPQEVWTDEGGKRRYATLLELSERDWRDALTEAVVESLRKHLDGIKLDGIKLDGIKAVSASGTPFGREAQQRAGLAGNGGRA
jgi:DNA-binding cell septation regulator SpoVG